MRTKIANLPRLFRRQNDAASGPIPIEAHHRPSAPKGWEIFDIAHLLSRPRHENEAAIRQLCHTARLDDAVLCRVLGRYKMYVDGKDEGLAPHLMLDGIWEMPVTEAVLGFVRGGMTVVDVGANHGYFTMLLADLVGAEGRVWAAEPNPGMMSLLRRSAKVNGFATRIQTVESPLSDRSGQSVVLHIPTASPQNASIMSSGGTEMTSVALTTTTLDDLIGDGPVDFIKIDVEGAEQSVWAGMERILARQQPLAIFIEFTPDRYQDPEGFLRHMVTHGFALAQVSDYEGVCTVGFAEVLAAPHNQDRILVLAR